MRVFAGRDGSFYELPDPAPILTGPAGSAVTYQNYDRIDGRISRAAAYFLGVHYTPYWMLRGPLLFLRSGAGGMTELVARRAGVFSLRAAESQGSFLEVAYDNDGPNGPVCPKPSVASAASPRGF